MLVRLLHATESVFDRGVAPWHTTGEAALLFDPCSHAFGNHFFAPLGDHFRGGAQPLDGDEPSHAFRIYAGVAERNIATERMSDDRGRRQLLLMDKLAQVVDVASHAVASVGRPLAVAVSAEIGCDDVPIPP